MTFRPDAGNSTRPDRRQVEGMIGELRSIADAMEAGILEPDGRRRWSATAFDLLERASIRRRHKLAVERSRRRGRGYADPAGNEAVDDLDDNDPELRQWRDWLQDVEVMLTYGRHALAIQDRATPAQQRPDKPEPGCRVCSRPGKPEPVYRADRCRWCYDFWLLWKADVPAGILKLRREGKRITEQAIRLELEEAMVG